MKKLSLIIAIVSIGLLSHAQFGVKGGLNVSTWRGDDAGDAKSLVGFYAGAYYNVGISSQFSFQPEVVFSAEGAKDDTNDETVKTNYINITPFVRFNSSGFFVGTGPQLGILLSAKDESGGVSVDIKDALKSINFSWALMTGYEMPSGFGFYVRYNLGLTSIADDADIDVKTGVFQVGLRYNFKMGAAK